MMSNERIEELERLINVLPKGNLVYKTIKGKPQPYRQWKENGKTVSRYISVEERDNVLSALEAKKNLIQELKSLKSVSYAYDRPAVPYLPLHCNAVRGRALAAMGAEVGELRKRDCFESLQKFIHGNYSGKICLLYGLRRTGKTTLLKQLIGSLTSEEQRKAVYIKIRTTDKMDQLRRDLELLYDAGYRHAMIDEVTLMEDFIDSSAILSDVFSAIGMKIVLSGTDSLGFWMTLAQELYDRAFIIHTTYIPFNEYSRVLGIDDVDEYIRYGGTLQAGELAFEDNDALSYDAAFRDDETTRRYIDTAICNNIQHSLRCCRDGRYLRHLTSLYEAGELTGAINRIIESMNHRFLLRVLTDPFKSHDLGSASQILNHRKREEGYTGILQYVDKAAITKKLMDLLEIRNGEDRRVGITQAHVEEIREYLKALDLIVDCPFETTTAGESEEYVIFTQPGMRYCQAQALVHVLVRDAVFSAADHATSDMVCNVILEDVRGRMLEDIVLLETARNLPKTKRAFKLVLSRSEIDMVVYDSDTNSCSLFEVKHSRAVDEHQYRMLIDEEVCAQIERKYGKITARTVIYRGENTVLENGIRYISAEEYLKTL